MIRYVVVFNRKTFIRLEYFPSTPPPYHTGCRYREEHELALAVPPAATTDTFSPTFNYSTFSLDVFHLTSFSCMPLVPKPSFLSNTGGTQNDNNIHNDLEVTVRLE